MNRRNFLRLAVGAAAAPLVAPAIPLNRVWSFPSVLAKLFHWRRAGDLVVPFSPHLGNLFLPTEWITAESLYILQNNLREIRGVEWFKEEDMYREFKVGSTVQVKMPQRLIIRDLIAAPVDYSGAPPTWPPVAQLKSG